MRGTRRGPRCALGALAAILLALVPAAAQRAAPRALTTPDGTRFLLVPVAGPPILAWSWARPAGVFDDPPGLEGLSKAVARAALHGTPTDGCNDPRAEAALLAKSDSLWTAIRTAQAAGEEPAADVVGELAALEVEYAALVDPGAWERRLRSAPATGTDPEENAVGVVLGVQTTVGGLQLVARQLHRMRESARLRGLHLYFEAVRREAQVEAALDPLTDLRAELVALAFAGHPFSRLPATARGTVPAVSRDDARRVLQRIHQPGRGMHVLVGNFDTTFVEEVLRREFAATELPAIAITPVPPAPPQRSERRARVLGPGDPAAIVGLRLPADADRATAAVLAAWLADGAESHIARGLRARGHPYVDVAFRAPYLGLVEGILLVEVREPAPLDDRPSTLRADLEALLETAASKLPTEPEMTAARARADAGREQALRDPAALADHLALRCGLLGERPEDVLRAAAPVTAEAVQALARATLRPERRVLVWRERGSEEDERR